MKKYNIAIIGATGLVGSMFIKLLEEYNIPINELKLYASSKSKGKIIKFISGITNAISSFILKKEELSIQITPLDSAIKQYLLLIFLLVANKA